MFTDTHCHLHDPKIADVRTVVGEALNAGVDKIINMGCCLETSMTGKELAESFKSVYFAAGYHPSDADKFSPDTADKIKELTLHEKCVAIGEIGLDYYWVSDNKEEQKRLFEEQLELANSLSMPVIVHDRDAHADTLELLKKHRPKGVLHSFSGSPEMAAEILKLGMYIGIGGALTFKNARRLPEVVEMLPLNRLLLETDAPYMTPVPYRSKLNHSAMIYFTAAKIAEIKNTSPEAIFKAARENTEKLFGI